MKLLRYVLVTDLLILSDLVLKTKLGIFLQIQLYSSLLEYCNSHQQKGQLFALDLKLSSQQNYERNIKQFHKRPKTANLTSEGFILEPDGKLLRNSAGIIAGAGGIGAIKFGGKGGGLLVTFGAAGDGGIELTDCKGGEIGVDGG